MNLAERKWVWLYALGLALVCTLPYLIGFYREGGDWVFTGFIFGVEDGNSYIAKMLAGSYGDWLFRTPYTGYEQQGDLIFLPYLLLGKLARSPALHLQLIVLFQIFRLVATPYAVFATYKFTSLFTTEITWRRWITTLSTIGGGLGWLLPVFRRSSFLGSLPLDFISPETFGFLAFLGLPHLVLARGLMLSALYAYLEAGRASGGSYRSGILLLLLTLVQSLATLTAFAVIAIHQGLVFLSGSRSRSQEWRKIWLPAAARAILPSLPIILFFVIRFSTDPFLLAWTQQNRILSPHPIHYLMAYGIVLVLAVIAILKKPWLEQPRWLLPVGWVLAFPLLAYFPHNLQRRLVEGVWVALLLLAALALQRWDIGASIKRWFIISFNGLSVISSIMLMFGSMQVANYPAAPAFIPRDQVEAYQWLEGNAQRGTIVLANYRVSNALPAWAPLRVIIGHGPESVGMAELEPQVQGYYSGDLHKKDREHWLRESMIGYVIFTQLERSQTTWPIDQEAYLTRVYGNETVTLYEVLDAKD